MYKKIHKEGGVGINTFNTRKVIWVIFIKFSTGPHRGHCENGWGGRFGFGLFLRRNFFIIEGCDPYSVSAVVLDKCQCDWEQLF